MADDLNPITRAEVFMSGNEAELTPITREEVILSGGDLTPVTRKEWFLKKYRGGGSSVTVEPLTVTSNGTQTAPSGKAYSPVTVNVPQPSGTINITTNGPEDVSMSAVANVDVNPSIVWVNYGTGGGTATLANPFPGLDFSSLRNSLAPGDGKYEIVISFDFSGMDVLYHPFYNDGVITAMAFLPDDGSGNPIGSLAEWGSNGIQALKLLSGGQIQDIKAMAASIPCNTIIYGTTEPTPAT